MLIYFRVSYLQRICDDTCILLNLGLMWEAMIVFSAFQRSLPTYLLFKHKQLLCNVGTLLGISIQRRKNVCIIFFLLLVSASGLKCCNSQYLIFLLYKCIVNDIIFSWAGSNESYNSCYEWSNSEEKKKILPCPKYDHMYLHRTLDGNFLIAS